jgi:hypothetical protein
MLKKNRQDHDKNTLMKMKKMLTMKETRKSENNYTL